MVTVDKSRKRFTIYRPDDPKVPPINSNPGKIFPEVSDDSDMPDDIEPKQKK